MNQQFIVLSAQIQRDRLTRQLLQNSRPPACHICYCNSAYKKNPDYFHPATKHKGIETFLLFANKFFQY